MSARQRFDGFATRASEASGSVIAFVVAVGLVATWLVEGVVVVVATGDPAYFFNDKYQLQINTLTTVLTFLLLFLVQYTQNKGDRALQLKLDVLIDASGASNRFATVEALDDDELHQLGDRVAAAVASRSGADDADAPGEGSG